MKQMRNVLIVGGSGFIGRHLIERLSEEAWVIHATCLPEEHPPLVANGGWLPCDIRLPDAMANWPRKCDALVYLAQSPGWRRFPEAALDTFEINVAGVVRAAEYARRSGVVNFIFASTGSVYNRSNVSAREDEFINLNTPLSHYVAAKLSSELLLKSYSDFYAIQILRIFIPYGKGQHSEMLIPQLVNRVREGIQIDLFGEDGMRINPVAVIDVVEAMARCLQLQESFTLNVAGPEILSLRDAGNSIGRVLGKPPRFKLHLNQPVKVLVGNTQMLKTRLGWTPETTFEVGLRMWLNAE